MKLQVEHPIKALKKGGNEKVKLAVKPVVYSGDRKQMLGFPIHPTKYYVTEVSGKESFAFYAQQTAPSYIIEIPLGKDVKVPYEITIPDSFPAQRITVRFLVADTWQESGHYRYDDQWYEHYKTLTTMASVGGKEVPAEKAIDDLGKWTEVQLEHVGPNERLQWHRGKDPEEFTEVYEEMKALRADLDALMARRPDVKKVYDDTMMILVNCKKAYEEADTTRGRQLLERLSRFRKRPWLQRIEWLRQAATWQRSHEAA